MNDVSPKVKPEDYRKVIDKDDTRYQDKEESLAERVLVSLIGICFLVQLVWGLPALVHFFNK